MTRQAFERDLLPLCKEEGIAAIPYNPIAGGLLSGKHDGTAPPPDGTRFALRNAGARYQARYWHEQEFATIESLRGVAQEAGMSMATLAVAWVLSHPAVTAPIVGASRPEQLTDSLAAAEVNGLPHELKAETRRNDRRLARHRCRALGGRNEVRDPQPVMAVRP